ncbi:putative non-specific serine/threonine protein kinase [Helianthus annuus]|nr:putative non-specific serine/threonine protein kinase [Helianthus annuus]
MYNCFTMSLCNTILAMGRKNILCLFFCMLGILACFVTSNVIRSDVDCLRSIHESLEDPRHELSSWNFNNNTRGFICYFSGVTCWNDQEGKVISVTLRDMGLRGSFPMGLRSCTSMQHLDLSGNYLSGSIPSNLAKDLPYIVSLYLSNNNLSGPIPPSFANFNFINVLRLDNNHLTRGVHEPNRTERRSARARFGLKPSGSVRFGFR